VTSQAGACWQPVKWALSKHRHRPFMPADSIVCAILNCGWYFDRLHIQPYQKIPLPLTVASSASQSSLSAGIDWIEEENFMQRLRIERPTQNHVMAVFEASALSFELPRAATLEDLAGRLAFLGERHAGALLRVDVRVSS
jgi:hypothetical protein